MTFTGTIAERTSKSIRAHAVVSYMNILKTLAISPIDEDDCVAQRDGSAYIASVDGPDLSYGFAEAVSSEIPMLLISGCIRDNRKTKSG